MTLRIDKHSFRITNQQITNQFYFSIDYDKDYILKRIFNIKIEGGFGSWRTLKYNSKRIEDGYDNVEAIGFFVDITIINIRIGIYMHPIYYKI